MRRALCLMLAVLVALTAAPAALAISAEEALFGSGISDGESASAGDVDIYAGTDAEAAEDYPTLRLGDRDGEDSTAYIVFLQNRLIELGYLSDAADGKYGENTQRAVSSFQINNGLPVTGVADAATQTLLYSNASQLAHSTVSDTSFGGELTRIQSVLGLWGFYGGKVDGLTGNETEMAISTFKQYMSELDPTFGVTPTPEPTPTPNPNGRFADMPTVVDELLNPPVDTSLTDASVTPALMEYINGDKSIPLYRRTVSKGDTGSEALRVQTRLHQLKYLWAYDGVFGNLSEMALIYFQKRNNLTVTGVADATTQELLFSVQALEAEEYVFPYKLIVDVSDQKVYVMQWTGSTYEGPVMSFACSSGKVETPTPLGTYQAGGKWGEEWYYFKEYYCYARWAYHIVGGVFFHSITYDMNKRQTGHESSLGRRASHGCIRLSVKNAKWIYDNCPEGTTVVIQD